MSKYVEYDDDSVPYSDSLYNDISGSPFVRTKGDQIDTVFHNLYQEDLLRLVSRLDPVVRMSALRYLKKLKKEELTAIMSDSDREDAFLQDLQDRFYPEAVEKNLKAEEKRQRELNKTRCRGIKKDGSRCRFMVYDGSKYCSLHKDQERKS